MLKRLVLGLVTSALLTGLAFAHGDPIMGTVTAVASDTVTIKNKKDDKPLVLMIYKTTKYLKDDKAATKSDLKIGTRVVIDAQMDTKMKMYVADEIKISAADAKPAAPATKSK